MRRITSVWILLSLLLFPLMSKAQDVPAVEHMPLDSASVDSGDELDELDDIDVRGNQLPECLAGLFSHDTLILGCELDLLPQKIVVKTKDGDVVYKIAPQFMLDTTLMNHHPADSIYHFVWTDEKVNPYGTMFDSLKDDVRIPMAGFVLPAPGYVTTACTRVRISRCR